MCNGVSACVVVGLIGSAAMAQEATTGSGFFVNRQGWLVTNAHVVRDCAEVQVNGVVAVSVVVDDAADLAAVHAPQPGEIARLTFRRNGPELAEPLALVGFPLPSLLSDGVKITLGEINALEGPRGDARYFQMSAPAQPGNSGGPILDENGLVLGVFAATLADAAFDNAQNLNFGLTGTEVFRFLDAVDVEYRDMVWPRGAVIDLGGPTIADRAVEASGSVAILRCVM